MGHHQAGYLPQAEAIYQKILQTTPSHPDALHLLGLIAAQRGQNEIAVELIGKAVCINPSNPTYCSNLGLALQVQGKLEAAIESYYKALSLKPNFAEVHFNLGHALQEQGKFDAAVESYHKALSLKPNYAEVYNNLGIVLSAQGKLDAAIESYHKALFIRSSYAEVHYNLGNALSTQGKLDAAIESYHNALALKPDHADTHNNLGNALRAQGNLDAAIESYHNAIRLDPKNDGAKHFIAALTANTTERAPIRYIEKLFDGYANKFDIHLVHKLEYKMPSELVGLLKQAVDLQNGEWDVLDLGCGTGLSGLEILPYTRQLIGVDLSTKMLAKAHVRNIYHRLVHSDLLPMMRGEKTSSYDVIIAADVFEYLGMLDGIVSEAKRLLRAGGYFMFSVESLDALPSDIIDSESKPEYKLNQLGRYAHSASYLEKLALTYGFNSLSMISTPLRLEKGFPVIAWAAVWKS